MPRRNPALVRALLRGRVARDVHQPGAESIGLGSGRRSREIHLLHRSDHKPRQMIRRQPIPQRRRQQKHLLTRPESMKF